MANNTRPRKPIGLSIQAKRRRGSFKLWKSFTQAGDAIQQLSKSIDTDLGDFFERFAATVLDPQYAARFREGGIEEGSQIISNKWAALSLFTVKQRMIAVGESPVDFGVFTNNRRPKGKKINYKGSTDSSKVPQGKWSGVGRDQPILQFTGKLRNAIKVIRSGRAKAGKFVLRYGIHHFSGATYALGLHAGFGKVPARPFLDLTPYLKREFIIMVDDEFERILEST